MSYLQHGTLPSREDSTAAEIKRIQKRASAYEWAGGQLYRKPSTRYPSRRRVPAPAERLPLVQRLHADMGHIGVSKCVRLLAPYLKSALPTDSACPPSDEEGRRLAERTLCSGYIVDALLNGGLR